MNCPSEDDKKAIVSAAIIIALLLFWFALSGCDSRDEKPVEPITSAQPQSPDGRIASLEAKLAAAIKDRDEIARLTALRDLAVERERQARADVARLNDALDEERISQAQAKVWWFAGIMGVLALAGAALAIFVPSVAKWALRLSLAAAAVAALAVFAAWLLPYLWWIGACVGLVGLVGGVVFWRLDAKSRDQVVKAVDAAKDNIPDYKVHFRQFIDEDADRAIDAARTRLGLTKR